VDWVFDPDEVDTFRWILLFLFLGFALVANRLRDERLHHAVPFVNAAGLSLLALAVTFAVEEFVGVFFGGLAGALGEGDFGTGWGWELFLLAGALALIAYATLDRQSGPGYLGAATLFLFVLIAAVPGEEGPSLIGWPLVLMLLTGGLLFLALRGPGAEAPPAAGEPPPAP
jgi:hypothetical protein